MFGEDSFDAGRGGSMGVFCETVCLADGSCLRGGKTNGSERCGGEGVLCSFRLSNSLPLPASDGGGAEAIASSSDSSSVASTSECEGVSSL